MEEIKKIDYKKHQCYICLDYLTRENTYYTPCLHRFHESCLRPWMNQKINELRIDCPVCRADISSLIENNEERQRNIERAATAADNSFVGIFGAAPFTHQPRRLPAHQISMIEVHAANIIANMLLDTMAREATNEITRELTYDITRILNPPGRVTRLLEEDISIYFNFEPANLMD